MVMKGIKSLPAGGGPPGPRGGAGVAREGWEAECAGGAGRAGAPTQIWPEAQSRWALQVLLESPPQPAKRRVTRAMVPKNGRARSIEASWGVPSFIRRVGGRAQGERPSLDSPGGRG